MMLDLEAIQEQSCFSQGSREWHIARLGKFTSSKVGVLMTKTPKAKDFSDGALSYICEVAAGRNLIERYKNDYFDEYLKRISFSSKSMEYGKESEELARVVYIKKTGLNVIECGFINHKSIEYFGDSPDGLIFDNDPRLPIGSLEIKCLDPKNFIKYKTELSYYKKSLKDIDPMHYWQCVTHMVCNNVSWCDYVLFDKMQKRGFHIERILVNEEDRYAIENSVVYANEFIKNNILC